MNLSKKIIVTGGTGYIGSHTCVELMEAGFDVTVIDNLSNSHIQVLEAIHQITGNRPSFHKIDLCNRNEILDIFKEVSPDAVIHFAALKAVGESVENPFSYYRNNITGLINLIEACKTNSNCPVVFSSSCSVYGEPDELPVRESTKIKPAQSPYANTKKIGEDILRDECNTGFFSAISLRYFNPVGAHPSHLIGEFPAGIPLNLVPILTQTAIGKRSSIKVFGNDYSTPDGTCIRDYIHVTDVAKAHVKAVERILQNMQKSNYEVFNIGTGKGHSVLEMINAFESISGTSIEVEITARRPGDVSEVFADTSLANRELGWKAESGIHEMLLSAWEWEKQLLLKSTTIA